MTAQTVEPLLHATNSSDKLQMIGLLPSSLLLSNSEHFSYPKYQAPRTILEKHGEQRRCRLQSNPTVCIASNDWLVLQFKQAGFRNRSSSKTVFKKNGMIPRFSQFSRVSAFRVTFHFRTNIVWCYIASC